jgi:endonuclease YncB( thermonuclease family)
MQRTGIIAAALIFFALDTQASGLRGTADKVVDGDTLWVCDERACHKVRLCGVNAPERGEAGYHDSKAALADLVTGKVVHCVQVGHGTPCDGRSKPTNHDRIVAQCFVDNLDIAGALVAEGHACDWVKFSSGTYSKNAVGMACP